MSTPSPILLELYRHRFEGVAEEMGVTLRRTSYSPNIKERLDFSCAVFDGTGRLVAQAAHIPVHLGAMPASVEAALATFSMWAPGDVVILNDPYAGGTHLPDLTMISPVFAETEDAPVFFVATRAHHADVGGMTPGSLPLSTEIYQEGLIIPPVKLYDAGVVNASLLQILLRNVRTPDERRGDLAAQQAAHAVGERRLHALIATHGLSETTTYATHLLAYSERRMRATVAEWPDGRYTFTDTLEITSDHPPAANVPITVTAHIADDTVTFDFTGSAPSVPTSLNAVLSITESACYYVVRCLAADDIPVNAGCFAPVRVTAPLGSVVNARPPAAVAGGNVETSQRMVDAVLGALAQALPDQIPAASQGTMNNLTIGGIGLDGEPFAYYETIAGGMGAGPTHPGLSGVHVHMTNTLNTPIEALERAFPFRIATYTHRTGSGGSGTHAGGDGLIRAYYLLTEATVTMLSTRRAQGPWSLGEAMHGVAGNNILIRANSPPQVLPAQFTRHLRAGDILRIETPGGGGWG